MKTQNEHEETSFIEYQNKECILAVDLISEASKNDDFEFSTMTIDCLYCEQELELVLNKIFTPFKGFATAFIADEKIGVISINSMPDLIITLTVNEEMNEIIVSVKKLRTYAHESGFDIDQTSMKVQYLSDELVCVPLMVLKELSFIQNKESFCTYIQTIKQEGDRFKIIVESVIISNEDFHDLIDRYSAFKGIVV